MSVLDRLDSWQVGTIALYPNAEDPTSLDSGAPFYNFLGIYTGFRVRMEDANHENRATGERFNYPIPVSEGYIFDIGATVEGPSLVSIAMVYGRGPYWMWLVNGNGSAFRCRVLINGAEFGTDGGTQTQSASLHSQGTVTADPIGAGP